MSGTLGWVIAGAIAAHRTGMYTVAIGVYRFCATLANARDRAARARVREYETL